MMDDGEFRTKAEEKDHLTTIIQEWNASRLDMFALTFPDKVLPLSPSFIRRVLFIGSNCMIDLTNHIKEGSNDMYF